ncbi:MAG: S41 family peptidase [Planctomycetota bacterium]|nr:S41 family peptidase [Planctomycetota bacterium]
MRPGIAILLSTAMLALLLAFLFASRGAGANQGAGASPLWDEGIEAFVRRKVAFSYVDELDEAKAREAFHRAMDAYVGFDSYCDFIPPEEYRRWKSDTAGRYAGLGVKIQSVEEGLHVVGVFPDGPAAKAGIQIGDTIVRASDKLLAGLGVEEITPLLKGTPRSVVRVGLIRGPRPDKGPAQGPEVEVSVTRAIIRPPTIFARRVGPDGRFVQVRLTDFTEETAEEFDRVLDREAKAKPVAGIILDVRHNGGGVLGIAVRVVDRFLRKGQLVVRMEGRGSDATKNYTASGRKDKYLDLPLVVLVDRFSASASEIVAGALQDHRRAVLVGARTYGKFLVQSVMEIPGKNAAVKLTTSRYYTPSGRSYQGPPRQPGNEEEHPEGAGLIPDVLVELTEEQKTTLRQFWVNEEGRPWNEIKRWPEIADDYVDPQLERALMLLQGELVLQQIQRGSRGSRRNG